MNLLAIDPGASGGIAWCIDGIVSVDPMPEGMSGQVDRLRTIMAACECKVQAVIERTGTYMPGNSGPSAAKFARHCGHLEAACYCLGMPTEQVAPNKWMQAMGALPKEKRERKRAIKELMQRRFPNLTVTLSTADALGILVWAMERKGV